MRSIVSLRMLHIAALVATFVIPLLVYALRPQLEHYLLNEDDLLENITAILFFLSFLAAFIFIRVNHGHGWPYQALIGLLGLLAGLDEISYGSRLFHFNVPIILGVEFDALHDVLQIGREAIRQGYVVQTIAVVLPLAVIGAAIAYWALVRRSDIRRSIWNDIRADRRFWINIILFGIIAQVIDLTFDRQSLLLMLEEGFEGCSAFLLLLISISAGLRTLGSTRGELQDDRQQHAGSPGRRSTASQRFRIIKRR